MPIIWSCLFDFATWSPRIVGIGICLSINTRNFVNKLIILYSTGVCFVEKHGKETETLFILLGRWMKRFWSDLYEEKISLLINRAPLVLWSKDVDRFFVMITNKTAVTRFVLWCMVCSCQRSVSALHMFNEKRWNLSLVCCILTMDFQLDNC